MTTFSIAHLGAILLNILIGFGLYQIGKRFKRKNIVFGGIFLGVFLFDNIQRIWEHNGGNPWNLLPFSLCGIAYLISIVAIFKDDERLFKYTAFFSLGTFIAIIAPSESGLQPILSLGSIRYNLTHIMIVIAQIFMYREMGYRIKKKDGIKVMYFLVPLSFLMFGLNILLDTNFMFLNAKLEGNVITEILGEWPIYLIWFYVLAFILSFLGEKALLAVQKKGDLKCEPSEEKM